MRSRAHLPVVLALLPRVWRSLYSGPMRSTLPVLLPALLGLALPGVSAHAQTYVVNGAPSKTCAWPTTVKVGGCTGTLVHPKVVIYAAHCGGRVRSANFGEKRPFARSVPTEYCKIYPGGGQPEKGGDHRDYAFCVLKEEVTDVPITPILYGCETEAIKVGEQAVVAGFGATLHGKSDGGIQREVVTTIDRIDDESGKVSIGGAGEGKGKGSCYGDSGGPLFLRLPKSIDPEQSWRVFGVTSYGDSEPQCDGQAWYGMMHDSQAVPWIEKESGIDITPCFDVDGTWNPTKECGKFPLDPGAERSWDNACQGGELSKMSSTCGPAFGSSDEGGESGESAESEGGSKEPSPEDEQPSDSEETSGDPGDDSSTDQPKEKDEPSPKDSPEDKPKGEASDASDSSSDGGCSTTDAGSQALGLLGLALLGLRRNRSRGSSQCL